MPIQSLATLTITQLRRLISDAYSPLQLPLFAKMYKYKHKYRYKYKSKQKYKYMDRNTNIKVMPLLRLLS